MRDPERDPQWGPADVVFLGVAVLFAIALLVYG